MAAGRSGGARIAVPRTRLRHDRTRVHQRQASSFEASRSVRDSRQDQHRAHTFTVMNQFRVDYPGGMAKTASTIVVAVWSGTPRAAARA
jgi:hypothetical protein